MPSTITKPPWKNRHDAPQALPTPFLDYRWFAAITALESDAVGVAQTCTLIGTRMRINRSERNPALPQLSVENRKRLRFHAFTKDRDAIQQILRARLARVGPHFLAIEFHGAVSVVP
jgi:hypothetical protein